MIINYFPYFILNLSFQYFTIACRFTFSFENRIVHYWSSIFLTIVFKMNAKLISTYSVLYLLGLLCCNLAIASSIGTWFNISSAYSVNFFLYDLLLESSKHLSIVSHKLNFSLKYYSKFISTIKILWSISITSFISNNLDSSIYYNMLLLAAIESIHFVPSISMI
jgi:hypothetical protein